MLYGLQISCHSTSIVRLTLYFLIERVWYLYRHVHNEMVTISLDHVYRHVVPGRISGIVCHSIPYNEADCYHDTDRAIRGSRQMRGDRTIIFKYIGCYYLKTCKESGVIP